MADLRCPSDNAPLWEFGADGVLLDRCNSCGGLWFDAGELETVMSRIQFTTSPAAALGNSNVMGSHTSAPSSSSMAGGEIVFEIVVGVLQWLACSLR